MEKGEGAGGVAEWGSRGGWGYQDGVIGRGESPEMDWDRVRLTILFSFTSSLYN